MAALGTALLEAAQKEMQSQNIDFPERYSGEYKHRRSVCGWQLYQAVGVTKGDRAGSLQQMMEDYRFFATQHVVIITKQKSWGLIALLTSAPMSPRLGLPLRHSAFPQYHKRLLLGWRQWCVRSLICPRAGIFHALSYLAMQTLINQPTNFTPTGLGSMGW